MGFHPEVSTTCAEENRHAKKLRVREGTTHACLVMDGARCVGWCQFGPPDELPRIKNRRRYNERLLRLPDWRITCFFVDRQYRRRGVAALALEGALEQVAALGGGRVEGYPEDTTGRSVAGTFLHTGSVSLFGVKGFVRSRPIGKHRWVVTRDVTSVEPRSGGTR